MNSWAFIKCLGEENLSKATEEYENRGFEIWRVVFCGIEARQSLISGKDEPINRYLLIARKPYLISEGEKA